MTTKTETVAVAALLEMVSAGYDSENFVCTDVDGVQHDLRPPYYVESKREGRLYRVFAGYPPDELAELGLEGVRAVRQQLGVLVFDPVLFLVTEAEHARMLRDGVIDAVDGQNVIKALCDRVLALHDGQRDCWHDNRRRHAAHRKEKKMTIAQPLYVGDVNGCRLRFFKPPDGRPDFPWAALEDLHECVGVPHPVRQQLLRIAQNTELPVSIASNECPIVVVPHYLAQGLIDVMIKMKRCSAEVKIAYQMAGGEALTKQMLSLGMTFPSDQWFAWVKAALNRHEGDNDADDGEEDA